MTRNELAIIALGLLLAFAVLMGVHLLIFGDTARLGFDLLEQVALLPLQVLILTLIVGRMLAERERQSRQHKMNMVIGTFFNAVGQELLGRMEDLVTNRTDLCGHLCVAPDWTEAQMREAKAFLDATELQFVARPEVLAPLRDLLQAREEFMLRLLENPMLLEHDTFADLLWAVFHLEAELAARSSLDNLPQPDLLHLANDAKRAYSVLLSQWLDYMIHLKRDYPYLFSFAARMNPLRPDARPEIG